MLVAWVHIDTDPGGIAGTICVECLKRIIDRQRGCDGGGIPEGKEACYAREPKEPRCCPRSTPSTDETSAKPNMRQQKFVKELAKGKSLAQAAREAGYSDKNANQSGYQGLAQLRGRVPKLLEDMALAKKF